MTDYIFSGTQYIRVTRGDIGPGVVDAGYPAPISNWKWESFGANGIDGALYSGSKCYFFSGSEYIRVSRGDQEAGILDPGYPAPISNWGWKDFGAKGIKAPLYSGGPLVPPPPTTGLISNYNYFLGDGGKPLTGVSATLNVDVDELSYTDFNDGTGENGNLVFGPFPESANQVITQSFQATTGGPPAGSAPAPPGKPAARTRALPRR